MENVNSINKQISVENERKVNNYVALIMICLAFIQVVFVLLFYFNPDIFPFADNGYTLLGFSIFILVPGVVQWVFPKPIKWMKYVLLPVLLIMLSYLHYLFSVGTLVLFVIPTVVVSLYNSKKYSYSIYGLSVLLLTLTTLITFFMAKAGKYSGVFGMVYDFSDPYLTFLNFYLCEVLLYLAVVVTSRVIMANTHNSIHKQVEASKSLIAIKSELDTASKIQSSILPTNFNLAVDQGYHLSALMTPAKEVGGDLYDFFYQNGRLFVLVGDVSDKGLSAAMFMMNVKNTIRALCNNETNIAKVLTTANKIISSNNKELMFVTMWIASIDLATGKGEFISAGHCPAFIKSSSGEIKRLDVEPQIFLGVDEKAKFVSSSFTLPKGCNLFLYTDGVTDAMNKNSIPFGEERLINSIKKDGLEPQTLLDNIYKDIQDYADAENQFDDITMLSLYNSSFAKEEAYPYSFDSVTSIVDTANAMLKDAGASEDTIDLIDTAIDDAVSNIIEYSKNDKSPIFIVKYSCFDGKFAILFVDDGVQFNPLESSDPDLSDKRQIGGLGIYLFKKIMDETYYQYLNNQNVLTLIKKIN